MLEQPIILLVHIEWKNLISRVNQQETILENKTSIMKNLNITRSAKKNSQPSNLGSSETTREAPLEKKYTLAATTFDFTVYFNHFKPQHIKANDSTFLEWFVGFAEGDGSFVRSNKRCYFFLAQKDIKILYKIKANLGFGQVLKYTQNNKTYGRYVVQDQKNCERLAYIFNGNLILNKTNVRFQLWIKGFNILPLKKLPNESIRLDNAWLSGFIDAEGCFYARVRKRSNMKLNYAVYRKFSLNQKGEIALFERLNELFSSNGKIQKIQTQNSLYYRIELCSLLSNNLLLDLSLIHISEPTRPY